MTFNSTPQSERLHIGFFGKRNAGKSSLVNALTRQNLSVVSSQKGTTTDPVYKSMEILPLGPVMIIDTPGFDDSGMLGNLRVNKTKEIIRKTDIAILVTDSDELQIDSLSDENQSSLAENTDKITLKLSKSNAELVSLFEEYSIPYLIVINKSEQLQSLSKDLNEVKIHIESPTDTNVENSHSIEHYAKEVLFISAKTSYGLEKLKTALAKAAPKEKSDLILKNLVSKGDAIILVIPIDESAPKGRIILPQQQVLREILDLGATAIVVKETELSEAMLKLANRPDLVITDSQVFDCVSKIVPENIPLTSFSILMARYKGILDIAIQSINALKNLQNGDKVLISEGCTHHRQCNDIGTVKIPRLLKKYTGKNIKIETSSGREFPSDLSDYKLVIHCGGCMLNEKEMQYRMNSATKQGIKFLNYGIFLAMATGIFERSIEVFKE